MRIVQRVLGVLAACTAFFAFATPQHKLATGLWIDPNESGWGLNLFHQGNTVFGSLFVYGPDGQPRWYTASNMTSSDDGPAHDHPASVSGDLYEASGPYFGGPFDPARVSRRKVGTMNIDLGTNQSGVVYSIDGVTVTKNVVPFTFRPDDLSGDYIGYLWQPASASGPEVRDEVSIHVSDNGSTATMNTVSTAHGACGYSGTRSQNRDFVTVSGPYTCSGTSGQWSMTVDVTPDGIMGSFNGPGISSNWGRIGGARTSAPSVLNTGLTNDLWFPPDEGGWGVNILEQGDTVFATLFVFDAQGKAHWYSASELRRAGPNANDGRYEYVGALYESTGPYFGTAFNASAVNRRVVGTMSFEPTLDYHSADLSYTVDGVQVRKRISRFAFQKNSLAGSYVGHIAPWAPGRPPEPIAMAIDDSNGFVMDTRAPDGTTCRYTAPLEQFGELRRVSGNFSCSNGSSDWFLMDNVAVQWNGFTGSFSGNAISVGHIEGVRTQVN